MAYIRGEARGCCFVAEHVRQLGVKVPCPIWWRWRARETQGRRHEASLKEAWIKDASRYKNWMKRPTVWIELAKTAKPIH